jgi:hypothetical protein
MEPETPLPPGSKLGAGLAMREQHGYNQDATRIRRINLLFLNLQRDSHIDPTRAKCCRARFRS